VIHKPPRVLYNDSAARHVDARASANAHKNAEGSICIYLMVYTEDKARYLDSLHVKVIHVTMITSADESGYRPCCP
jgi:hypothetical protein